MFLSEYKTQIVLPPKILFYEPRMFGFAIAGKRGSKYFTAATGACQLSLDKFAGLHEALANGKTT